MRRWAVYLVLLFLGVIGVVSSSTLSVHAENSDPAFLWSDGVATVTRNDILMVTQANCSTTMQNVYVAEQAAYKDVCMYGDGEFRIGSIGFAGSPTTVVKLPFGDQVHLLLGVCSYARCVYLPGSDQLVTEQQVGDYARGIVVYAHASKRIKKVETSSGVIYEFNRDAPNFELTNELGSYIPTEAIAASNNGKYIAFELKNGGIAVMDTESYAVRQITTNGYRYGYGYDPTEHLAISNNGKHVVVTGLNAGFTVFDITGTCGQALLGDLAKQPNTVECRGNDAGFFAAFPNFRTASFPRFYGNGEVIELRVENWGQPLRKVVLTAHGQESAHRIQLLSLGDSFVSGEGELDASFYQPEVLTQKPCDVSARSYPYLVGADMHLESNMVRNVACAGAQLTDIVSSQNAYQGQNNRIAMYKPGISNEDMKKLTGTAIESFQSGIVPQSEFVSRYNPAIITVGVGGNDAGLMGKLRTCIAIGTCEWALPDMLYKTYHEISRLFDGYIGMLKDLKEKAPSAKVYVVGYPNIITNGSSCGVTIGSLLDATERTYMQNGIHYLNQTLKAATEKAGVLYVDVENAYGDQALCGGVLSSAMNGVRLGNDVQVIETIPLTKIIGAGTFHPTPTGHSLVASAFLTQYPSPLSTTMPIEKTFAKAPAIDANSNENQGVETYQTSNIAQTTEGGRVVAVHIPQGSLRPETSVRIEVHSEVKVLETTTSDADGSMNTEVTIPLDVEAGSHSVHVFTSSASGNEIELYQFIDIASPKQEAVGPTEAPMSEGVSTSPTNLQQKNTVKTLPQSNMSRVASLPMIDGVTYSAVESNPTQPESVLGVQDVKKADVIHDKTVSTAKQNIVGVLMFIGSALGFLVLSFIVILLAKKWRKRRASV